MNLLWHVSFDPVDKFIPRVPESRASFEDSVTPRICFSEHIKDAITAMPQGGIALRGMLKCKSKITPLLYAYVCDANEHPDSFIPPEIVQGKYGVLDAEHNREWWAIAQINPKLRILLIEDAAFREATDSSGKKGVIVESLNHDLIKTLPKNAPVNFFGGHAISGSLRQIFAYADEELGG